MGSQVGVDTGQGVDNLKGGILFLMFYHRPFRGVVGDGPPQVARCLYCHHHLAAVGQRHTLAHLLPQGVIKALAADRETEGTALLNARGVKNNTVVRTLSRIYAQNRFTENSLTLFLIPSGPYIFLLALGLCCSFMSL